MFGYIVTILPPRYLKVGELRLHLRLSLGTASARI